LDISDPGQKYLFSDDWKTGAISRGLPQGSSLILVIIYLKIAFNNVSAKKDLYSIIAKIACQAGFLMIR